MLEHDRIGISGGIDINKTNASKECDICHYWYFNDVALLFLLKKMIIEFIFGI